MTNRTNLLTLFNSRVEERGGSYVVEIPAHEIEIGEIQPGQSYRVAMFSPVSGVESEVEAKVEAGAEGEERMSEQGVREPPVEKGETVEVEVEDIGEQGDGIARIGPGYIVFVPGADIGDRVTVEINQVRENFAFGEVVEGPY